MLDNDDVRVIIEALFDIRTELRRIGAILDGEDEDDSEGSEEEDS
ncbi:MAG: hypothetical protein ABI783_07075 [Actinomycetota bacterium]